MQSFTIARRVLMHASLLIVPTRKENQLIDQCGYQKTKNGRWATHSLLYLHLLRRILSWSSHCSNTSVK